MADEVVEAEVVEGPTVAGLATVDPADALVRPAASIADIEQAYEQYEQLKKRLLKKTDLQQWSDNKGDHSFVKRSGWRKLAIAFGVSFEIQHHQIITENLDDPESNPVYAEFVVRARAPNGRFADGWGACSIKEDRFDKPAARKKLHHDLPATAETRAKNRAAADLFGMGEVSAEEMNGGGNQGRGARSSPGKGPKSESPPPAFQKKKDPNHEHTWAAPPSGRAGIEACTECGDTRKVS